MGCEPLPPSWAPWLVGWAERGCGNGCLESRGSRDCCNRFCLQTLAAHLGFADRTARVRTLPCSLLPVGAALPRPRAHPLLPVQGEGGGCTFFYSILKEKLRFKGNFLISQKEDGLHCLDHQ